MPPHDYPYHWVILDPKSKDDKVKVTNFKNLPKFQIFEFWNGHYTRHTFWSCLIRCANMKWIRWVLLKIQSGHDSVHRRTDGQGDTSIPPYELRWSGRYNYSIPHCAAYFSSLYSIPSLPFSLYPIPQFTILLVCHPPGLPISLYPTPKLTILLVSHSEDDLWRTVVARDDIRRHHEACACRAGQTKV